jgi:glycosyltransferase involved in cell wall biosynthesis
MNAGGVCVIMPAYNEAKAIARVLSAVTIQIPASSVIVINDGSRDATSDLARKSGVQVLDLPFNLGIGGAVQTGLKYALHAGYDVAVEVDADGQHNAAHIQQLIDALGQHQVDMVIGSRFMGQTVYRASFMRRAGIFIFSLLIKLVTGTNIYDSTSGFRAYNRRAITFLAHHYPSDFPEPESIVMLLKGGFSIKEVPVEMNKRLAGKSSLKSDFSWRAIYFVISNSIAILVSALKTHAR